MSKVRYLYAALILSFIFAFGGAKIVEASTGIVDLHPVNGIWQVADNTADEMSEPSPFDNWQFIVAFLLPLGISLLIKQHWEEGYKAVAAFAICFVVTVIGTYLSGGFTSGVDLVTNVLKVFALTIPFYYGIWKPVGATMAIHQATG